MSEKHIYSSFSMLQNVNYLIIHIDIKVLDIPLKMTRERFIAKLCSNPRVKNM